MAPRPQTTHGNFKAPLHRSVLAVGVLRRLRGELPCVPYGSDIDRIEMAGWPLAIQ